MLIIICGILVLFCRVSCVLPHEREDSEVVLTLEDVLTFVTGASCIPPMGFDTPPQITFCHDNSHYPTASTCVPSIKIPCSLRDVSLFSTRMTEASWSGWIWQSLTLLIFCTFSLQVFITCTVYSVYTCL